MSYPKTFFDWIGKHPWEAVGAVAGFVLGILILAIGFLNTLLIFLLAIAGFIIGKIKEDNGSVISAIKDFFERKRKR